MKGASHFPLINFVCQYGNTCNRGRRCLFASSARLEVGFQAFIESTTEWMANHYGYSLTSIIDNYRNQAGVTKTRFENEQFIELFDIDLVTLPKYLPAWFVQYQKMLDEERNGSHSESITSKTAYERFYFETLGPLTSPEVHFSVKKSIVDDEDD